MIQGQDPNVRLIYGTVSSGTISPKFITLEGNTYTPHVATSVAAPHRGKRFQDANQISRLSTSQTNIPFLCRSGAPRGASAVFIAFSRAPPVIYEALKRAWCRRWTFYRRTAFFCRAHTHRLLVIKFRASTYGVPAEPWNFAAFHDIATAMLYKMLQFHSILTILRHFSELRFVILFYKFTVNFLFFVNIAQPC